MELVQKIAEEGKLTNSFHEATITLKTGKDTTFKKREREREKKIIGRPISLINIDVKTINEKLANVIQQYIKKIICHDQVGFIPEMQRFNIFKQL